MYLECKTIKDSVILADKIYTLSNTDVSIIVRNPQIDGDYAFGRFEFTNDSSRTADADFWVTDIDGDSYTLSDVEYFESLNVLVLEMAA